MEDRSNMNWSRGTLLALSLTALGRAIQIDNGALGRPPYPAIWWLSFAIVFALSGIFLPRPLPIGQRLFRIVVGLCLLINFAQLITKFPCQDMSTADQVPAFEIGVVVEAFLCGMIIVIDGITRKFAFMGLLLTTGYLGNWAIVNCPNPRIDVYVFQTDSAAALSEGRNPYAITFPNVFAPDTSLYGRGIVKGGRVQFGYPYFPETLFAIMPASLLQLDVRYPNLLSILASAILIVVISPGLLGYAAALLFITTPRLCFVVEKSWIEPIVVLTLVWTVACTIKWPRLLPVALGLFLASKQYVPAAAALVFVSSRPLRETVLLLIKAWVVTLIVTIPLALWNAPAFWHSVVELQFRQPFRWDALSYLSWMGERFWPKPAIVIIPFAALLLTMALALWRRRSVGFAGAIAVCFLMFFALNKQAFANYYFFIIGALACAIAEVAPGMPGMRLSSER